MHYCTCTYMQQICAHNAEHMYHVLETPHYQFEPQCLNGAGSKVIMIPDSECPSSLKPVSSPSHKQVPIYQDIAELSTSESIEAVNGVSRIGGTTRHLSPSKMESQPQTLIPVYQVIDELSTEMDSSVQNDMHVYAQVPSAGTSI